MSAQRLANVLAAFAALGLGACGEDDHPYDEHWDALIAICPQRLSSIDATCDRISSSTADVVFAHALFGKAGGHRVGIAVETVTGGTVRSVHEADVPPDRRWLEGLQLSRAACKKTPCVVRVGATVDGERVAHQRFEFR